jgi:hypothetical protein
MSGSQKPWVADRGKRAPPVKAEHGISELSLAVSRLDQCLLLRFRYSWVLLDQTLYSFFLGLLGSHCFVFRISRDDCRVEELDVELGGRQPVEPHLRSMLWYVGMVPVSGVNVWEQRLDQAREISPPEEAEAGMRRVRLEVGCVLFGGVEERDVFTIVKAGGGEAEEGADIMRNTGTVVQKGGPVHSFDSYVG